MKKNLSILTGIILVLMILISGACNKQGGEDYPEDSNKVTIYYKVIMVGKEMHLEMYNSYNKSFKVVDSLWTEVKPKMKVIWEPLDNSGIKKVKRIGPSKQNPKIFKTDAHKVFLSKKFKFRIPREAKQGEDKYDIKFEAIEGGEWTIDPHLIIPDETPEDISYKKAPSQ